MSKSRNKDVVGVKNPTALIPRLRFRQFLDSKPWSEFPMGELYSFISTNSLSRDKLNYNYGSVRNIHYGDIHTKYSSHFDVRKETVPYITDGSIDSFNKVSFCEEGDLLLADASEDTKDIGKCIEISHLSGEKVVGGLHTIHARRLDGKVASGFGGHLFQSRIVREQIQREAQGAKVLGISANRLRKILLCIPQDILEQQQIAECLSSLDELIAAQARKVEALKTHKKGLMQQLFPQEGETVPRLRFSEFRNADDWTVSPFERFVIRSFYGTSKSTNSDGEYPVLRMGNMVDGSLELTNLVFIDLDKLTFNKFRLETGDVLLNRTNSPALVGKIALFPFDIDILTASYIVTFRLDKEQLDPVFCNFMLNTRLYQSKIRSFAKPSVSQANINPTTFKKELMIAVPNLEEQKRVAKCLSSIEDSINAHTKILNSIMHHKKGLSQRLFPSNCNIVG